MLEMEKTTDDGHKALQERDRHMRLTIRGNVQFEQSCDIRQVQKDRWNSDGDVDTTDAQDTD